MTLVHDSRKYVVKTLIFLAALLTLLSFGYLVQAEEARSENEPALADTMTASSESFDSVAIEESAEEPTEVEVIEAPVFEQTGTASWYGNKFHGRRTANGERYDMHAYTAAHRSLPFGTIIRVTNLDNNRSTLVRVNDRGPFVRGRIIDLSRAAAEEIGVTLHRVKIEQFRPESGQAFGFRSDYLPLTLDRAALSGAFTTDNFTRAMTTWKDITDRGQHAFLVLEPRPDDAPKAAKSGHHYTYVVGTVQVPALAMR